jgi:K(+)-stimulated pyrophosphate-energized sodium pump
MSPQNLLFTLISVISVIGLLAAVFFAKWVLAKDTGADNMRKISDAIQAGAEAFMKRMNTTIIYMAAGVAVLVFLFYWKMRAATGEEGVSVTYLAIWTMVAFVLGALCSLIAGYIGMWISIRTNIRTASAARRSLNERCRRRCAAARSPACWWSSCRSSAWSASTPWSTRSTPASRPPRSR